MQMTLRDRPGLQLLFILALAALLRLWGLGARQLWSDEILQVLHSRPDTVRGILDAVTIDRGGAPLDYLVQHVFITNLSGAIEWTARLHAALFGILAVLLVYLVCRELSGDQKLSLMSALLFCFYPFHHHYSQEGRPYSLFVLLTLVLYFHLFRLMKRNRWLLWGSFAVSAVLAFYTHAYTAMVFFGQACFLIFYQLHQRESWTKAWRRYACFIFCGALAAASFVPWLLHSFFNAKGEIAPEIGGRLFFETIKRLGDGSYPLSAVLIICASFGIHSLYRQRRTLELGALLTWIIAPIPVILAVLLWRTYFFTPRQLLFITPAFFILVAAGVQYLKQKVAHRYFHPEAVLILISIVVIALHYPDKRDDLRAAGQFLKETVRPADMIVAPALTDLLSLYFPEIRRYSADHRSAQDLLQTAGKESRVLYVTLRYRPDPEGLNRLLTGMQKSGEVHFRGVTVYLLRGI